MDALSLALGAPAQQILRHAENHGPSSGWKDGFLSRSSGVLPTDTAAWDRLLQACLGRVWLTACQRLPALIAKGGLRSALSALPVISGTSDTIPDLALWAAYTTLIRLTSAFVRAESDEELGKPASELPTALSVPFAQVSTRLGFAESPFSPYASWVASVAGTTTVNDRNWLFAFHDAFSTGTAIMAHCQERVIKDDATGLMRSLLELREIVDDMTSVLAQVTPEELGETLKPVDATSDATPGLMTSTAYGLPAVQLIHAFMGQGAHTVTMNEEIARLRPLLPINLRAFATAIEQHHPIHSFVTASKHPQLLVAWSSLVDSYRGHHGLLAVLGAKKAAALQLAVRTGHTIPLDEVESKEASAEMQLSGSKRPGTEHDHLFEACNVRARVLSRSAVDEDPYRTTALVTLSIQEPHGLPFRSGDRLLVMPLNAWAEVEKIAAALGLDELLDLPVPLYGNNLWDTFAHQHSTKPGHPLLVRDVLRYGQISPLSHDQLSVLDKMFHGTSPLVTKLLSSNPWPIAGTLGDVLQLAIGEVSPVIWDSVFDLAHLSWLPEMIPVAQPRSYGVSSPPLMGSSLPSTVKITVKRCIYEAHPSLDNGVDGNLRYGASSGALNPDFEGDYNHLHDDDYPLLVGIADGSNLRLTSGPVDNVVMLAEAESVGVFRSFWRARSNCLGQTVLFLALQSLDRYPFRNELDRLQQTEQIKVFTSSHEENDAIDPSRLLESALLDQGRLVCDLLSSISEGGQSGHFYISGSMKLYQSIVTGIRRALFNADWRFTQKSTDDMIAQAIVERRFFWDIYPEPQPTPTSRPKISPSQLARQTGHRASARLWMALRGHVYDLTNFHKLSPSNMRLLRLNAGTDATGALATVFSSSRSLSGLLPQFRIGDLCDHLTTTSEKIRSLHSLWTAYLGNVVQALTGLALQSEAILGEQTMKSGGGLDRNTIFAFLSLQERMMTTGISPVFGTKLQELQIRTAFAYVSSSSPDSKISDIMAIIDRVRHSSMYDRAMQELEVLRCLMQQNRPAQRLILDAMSYVRAVLESQCLLLENVREEVCTAVDSIRSWPGEQSTSSSHELGLTNNLMLALERIACRYTAFWERLAAESIGRTDLKQTRLRAKHDMAILPQLNGPPKMVIVGQPLTHRQPQHLVQCTVNFAHLVDQVMKMVNEENLMAAYAGNRQRTDTASPHGTRASRRMNGQTTYDDLQHRKAINDLSAFLGASQTAIRRLSQLPSDLSFAYIMATYGRGASSTGHARSASAARDVLRTMDSQAGNETPRPRLIRRRTNTSSVSSTAPQSIFSSPDAATPETKSSENASPAFPLQLRLHSKERSLTRTDDGSITLSERPEVGVRSAQRATVRLPRAGPPIPRKQSVTFAVSSLSAQTPSALPQPDGQRLPALLPSPVFPRDPDNTARVPQPMISSDVNKEANIRPAQEKQFQHNPIVHQLYTFSTRDGLAAGRPRAKHLPPSAVVQSEVPIPLEIPIEAPESPPKFQAPRRSRTVERIFTHAKKESYAVRKSPIETSSVNSPVREVAQTESLRHRATAPTVTPGLWMPDDAKALSRDIARPISTRTQGYVGLWMRPASKIVSEDFLAINALCKNLGTQDVHKVHQTSRESPPQSAALWGTDSSEPEGLKCASTLGYVGMWMQPSSQKANDDFDMVCRGEALPSAIAPQTAEDTQPTTQICPARVAVLEHKAPVAPQTLATNTTKGLWQPPASGARSLNGRTAGYVGMWMKPASRVKNSDFELARANMANLNAAHSRAQLSRAFDGSSVKPAPLDHTLWSSSGEQGGTCCGLTLGRVGLWMNPPSKKVNLDFEQHVVNTMNYLFGSRSGMLKRMATAMHLRSAELHVCHWNLRDWTEPGLEVQHAHTVAVLVDRNVPVTPSRNLQPLNFVDRTLGQVGLWMYPPSQKRNIDFDAFSAASDAAPEIPTSMRVKGVSKEVEVCGPRLRCIPQPDNTTLGTVGLWMNPPSRKVNEDFEAFKIGDEQNITQSPAQPEAYAAALVDGDSYDPIEPALVDNIDLTEPHSNLELAREHDRDTTSSHHPGYGEVTQEEAQLYHGMDRSFRFPTAADDMEELTEDTDNGSDYSAYSSEYDPGARFPNAATPAFVVESPTLPEGLSHTPAMTPSTAATINGLALHGIDFDERMRELNMELDMAASDVSRRSAAHSPLLPPNPQDDAGSPLSFSNKRAAPQQLDLRNGVSFDEEGFELLSAATYTPVYSAKPSALLAPTTAAHRQPVSIHQTMEPRWEQSSVPQPIEVSPAPLRSQSVKQPSRVNSVRNMWEKRASLVMDVPVLSGLRGRVPPPKPLKLHQPNSRPSSRSNVWMNGEDSATIPGFVAVGGQVIGRRSPHDSPMSPPVQAY